MSGKTKATHAVMSGDEIIAIIYENPKWGRTIVQSAKARFGPSLKIYSLPESKLVKEVDFAEFINDVLFQSE